MFEFSFDDIVRRLCGKEFMTIERVCEQAVQSGRYGVKVNRTVDGRFVSAEVSEEVPFGMIHEHRDQIV